MYVTREFSSLHTWRRVRQVFVRDIFKSAEFIITLNDAFDLSAINEIPPPASIITRVIGTARHGGGGDGGGASLGIQVYTYQEAGRYIHKRESFAEILIAIEFSERPGGDSGQS